MGGQRWGRLLLLAAFPSLVSNPANAEELPASLTSMIREAHPSERKTVINVAKRLYPGSTREIDALATQIEAEERQAVAQQSYFEGWAGEASVGVFIETGHTDEWGLSLALAGTRRSPHWTHEISIGVDLKGEEGKRTEERINGRYTLRRRIDDSSWFGFGRLSYKRNPFQGIDRRFFEAAGIGYQIVDKPRFQWDLMAGPGLRQTAYTDGTNANDVGAFVRLKLGWRISDTIRFSEEADAGLARRNSTFTSMTSLTTDLYGRLSGRLSFGLDYESDPPEGREKVETFTRASLVYDF
jgi:putative salt-induced outer membrane protein